MKGAFKRPFSLRIFFSFSCYFCNFVYICSLSKKNRVMAYVISEDCTACGTCIDECPVEAISSGNIYKIDPDICTDCGSCADVCPVEAIHPE